MFTRLHLRYRNSNQVRFKIQHIFLATPATTTVIWPPLSVRCQCEKWDILYHPRCHYMAKMLLYIANDCCFIQEWALWPVSGFIRKTEAAAHGESATDACIVLSFWCSSNHLLPYICRFTLVIKKDKQTTHKSLLITKSLTVSHNNSISAHFSQRQQTVIDSNRVYNRKAWGADRERHTDRQKRGECVNKEQWKMEKNG